MNKEHLQSILADIKDEIRIKEEELSNLRTTLGSLQAYAPQPKRRKPVRGKVARRRRRDAVGRLRYLKPKHEVGKKKKQPPRDCQYKFGDESCPNMAGRKKGVCQTHQQRIDKGQDVNAPRTHVSPYSFTGPRKIRAKATRNKRTREVSKHPTGCPHFFGSEPCPNVIVTHGMCSTHFNRQKAGKPINEKRRHAGPALRSEPVVVSDKLRYGTEEGAVTRLAARNRSDPQIILRPKPDYGP